MYPLKLHRAESNDSTHEQTIKFRCFIFQHLISMQGESNSTKKAQVVVIWFYGCLVLSSNVRQLIVKFLKSGLGEAASLQPHTYVFE